MEPLSRSLQMIKANLQSFAHFELVQESELKFPATLKSLKMQNFNFVTEKSERSI